MCSNSPICTSISVHSAFSLVRPCLMRTTGPNEERQCDIGVLYVCTVE